MKDRRTSRASPLLFSDSEKDADQLYFGRVFVPDRFISFAVGKKSYAVVNAMEYSRLKRESAFTEVLFLEEWLAAARRTFRKKEVGVAEVIRLVAREFQIPEFVISHDFPAGLAFQLRAARVRLVVADGPLFPGRLIKSDEEAWALQKGNVASAAGLRAAERLLCEAVIEGKRLLYGGRELTAERVRHAIRVACLEKGAMAAQTIVAGGDQACDPHCEGHGPLFANQLIVVDIFPRMMDTGYYGDMTRTFLRGRASEAQRRLVAVVRGAQRTALSAMKARKSGATVHGLVERYFEKKGYRTEVKNGVSVGFFHGTGHGVGLEIHEEPRLSRIGSQLRTGMVTSVEPGLYYPGLGGCRIEDIVRIRRDRVEMLSEYHYHWEFD